MLNYKKNLGKLGEDLAVKFLSNNGYSIVDRNFLIRGGEVDIIATKEEMLVFVEVKTRVGLDFGLPEEAITPWKMQAIIKTAQFYHSSHPNLPKSLRVDLVAVEFDNNGVLKRIELIENITG